MDIQKINSKLIELVGVAVGGDYLYTEQLSDDLQFDCLISRDQVIGTLQEAGFPIADIVKEDLDEIYSGGEPIYFVPYKKVAENYRHRHGLKNYNLSDSEEDYFIFKGTYPPNLLERIQEDKKAYGISLEPYRDGMACLKEREYFYTTQEWQNRAKVVRALDSMKCRNCNRSVSELSKLNIKLHVHHEYPIQSINSRIFVNNFDSSRLKSLCEECHSGFHSNRIRRSFGYTPASTDEIKNQKDFLKKLEAAHNKARECKFCF